MKAYDLNFPGIHGSSCTDEELNKLVAEAGYSSTRSYLNEDNCWHRDVDSIKAGLRNQIENFANEAE